MQFVELDRYTTSITCHVISENCPTNIFDCTAWIGLNDREVEGTFIWDHSNAALNFTNWYPGEPSMGSLNEAKGKDCVDILRGGLWNDRFCSFLNWAICEKDIGLWSPNTIDIFQDQWQTSVKLIDIYSNNVFSEQKKSKRCFSNTALDLLKSSLTKSEHYNPELCREYKSFWLKQSFFLGSCDTCAKLRSESVRFQYNFNYRHTCLYISMSVQGDK